MENTNLRQSIANARATGVVSEINLAQKKDKNGKDVITGTVVIKVSDTNSITYRVYASKTTKAGEENPAWAGLQTVMSTYRSIAEVGEANATKVHVNGQYAPSTYVSQMGMLREGIPQYRTSFFSEVKGEFHPMAEIEVELFIRNIVPEIKDDEETGRKLLNGWINLYNGLEPVTLIVPADMADGISDYEPGTTAIFFADVVNTETVKEVPVRLGKPRKVVSHVSELVINGAEEPESEEKGFNQDAMRAAINTYKERIEALKSGDGQVKKAAPSTKTTVAW